MTYALDREATGLNQNTLTITTDPRAGYLYSISGQGFASDKPLDVVGVVRSATVLSYSQVGTYTVHLAIYQQDGSLLLEDSLSWEYSTEMPPEASVAFSDPATPTSQGLLRISSFRGPNVHHIYILGDVHPDHRSADDWYPIPSSGEVVVPLSPGDGVKQFHVKMRNRFYNETTPVDLQIIRKSTGPEQCAAIPIAPTSATESTEFYIRALDPYPLTYQIDGTGARRILQTELTDNAQIVDVTLTNGTGDKEVTVTVTDIAGNQCAPITQTITVDPSYLAVDLNLSGNALIVDDEVVVLDPHFDHFDHLVTEMLIEGNVADNDKTFEWVPFEEQLEISLLPSKGHRTIDISYRDERGVTGEATLNVFLRPFLILKGVAPNHTLIPSPIHQLAHMTITGCTEGYSEVAHSFSLPCTADGNPIQATYVLTDGQTITVTAAP